MWSLDCQGLVTLTLSLFRGVPNWFEGGDTLCPFKVGRLLIMYCTRILAFPLTDHVQQDFCTPGLYTVLKVTLKSTCLICSYTELFPRVLLGIFGVASVSNRVTARKLEQEQKKKVEGGGGGEKRKRLPANPTILKNAPWYFTVRLICKLTARQNRSITPGLPDL